MSKFYDENVLNSNYNNSLQLKGTYPNKNDGDIDKNPVGRKDIDKPENSGNPFECNVIKVYLKENNALEDNNCESPNKHKQVDDGIIGTMQAQLNCSDNAISKDHLENNKRLKEIIDE